MTFLSAMITLHFYRTTLLQGAVLCYHIIYCLHWMASLHIRHGDTCLRTYKRWGLYRVLVQCACINPLTLTVSILVHLYSILFQTGLSRDLELLISGHSNAQDW